MSSVDSNANQWSALLLKASEEIRAYPTTDSFIAESFFAPLASACEDMASLPQNKELETKIHAAGQKFFKFWPIIDNPSPSFGVVLDALQRLATSKSDAHETV